MELEALRAILVRRAVKFAKRRGSSGQRAWAEAHGVLNSRVSEFLSGKRLPNDAILNALGFEWRIVRKKRLSAREHRLKQYLADEKSAQESLETHPHETRELLRAWQTSQCEWFSGTVLEIVAEFIEWNARQAIEGDR